MSYPKKSVIPDRVCVVDCRYSRTTIGNDPVMVYFSSKIDSAPPRTLTIIDNIFKGPFGISNILQLNNSDFYSLVYIQNAIKSDTNPVLETNLRHWALNEIIMDGRVGKGGILTPETELVAVVYGQYSTMILKDGPIYNAIKGK